MLCILIEFVRKSQIYAVTKCDTKKYILIYLIHPTRWHFPAISVLKEQNRDSLAKVNCVCTFQPKAMDSLNLRIRPGSTTNQKPFGNSSSCIFLCKWNICNQQSAYYKLDHHLITKSQFCKCDNNFLVMK